MLTRTLRAWSIASLVTGLGILCLLALMVPTLRGLVPPPTPAPTPPSVSPQTSWPSDCRSPQAPPPWPSDCPLPDPDWPYVPEC